MTLDELVFLQQQLEEIAPKRVIVALGELAQAWKSRQKAKRARLKLEREALVANTDSESVFESPGLAAEDVPVAQDKRKTIARKALLMAPGLTPAGRAIGARLVERYNLSTGRCDVSIDKLGADEGYEARQVRRAIKQLCRLGLVSKKLMVGRGRTNQYTPQWDALDALLRRVENTDSENRTLQPNPDGNVTQNHKKIPTSAEVESKKARQLELRVFGQVKGGKGGDPVETAILAKYHGDHEALSAYLAGWVGLDDSVRSTITDLAGFEAWMRAHGPPRSRRAG